MTDDTNKRDEVLKRMLKTPPKPHDDKGGKKSKIKKRNWELRELPKK